MEGIERYDFVVGGAMIAGFESGVLSVVSEATIGAGARSLGPSGGTSFQSMRASFVSFQKAVDANLVEQRRVGGTIASMVEGVHRRVAESSTSAGT